MAAPLQPQFALSLTQVLVLDLDRRMRQAEARLHCFICTEKRCPGLVHASYDKVAAHGVNTGRYRPNMKVVDSRHAGNVQQLTL